MYPGLPGQLGYSVNGNACVSVQKENVDCNQNWFRSFRPSELLPAVLRPAFSPMTWAQVARRDKRPELL